MTAIDPTATAEPSSPSIGTRIREGLATLGVVLFGAGFLALAVAQMMTIGPMTAHPPFGIQLPGFAWWILLTVGLPLVLLVTLVMQFIYPGPRPVALVGLALMLAGTLLSVTAPSR